VDAEAIFGRAERTAGRLADVVRAGLAQER
jgi:hypothetical protein